MITQSDFQTLCLTIPFVAAEMYEMDWVGDLDLGDVVNIGDIVDFGGIIGHDNMHFQEIAGAVHQGAGGGEQGQQGDGEVIQEGQVGGGNNEQQHDFLDAVGDMNFGVGGGQQGGGGEQEVQGDGEVIQEEGQVGGGNNEAGAQADVREIQALIRQAEQDRAVAQLGRQLAVIRQEAAQLKHETAVINKGTADLHVQAKTLHDETRILLNQLDQQAENDALDGGVVGDQPEVVQGDEPPPLRRRVAERVWAFVRRRDAAQ